MAPANTSRNLFRTVARWIGLTGDVWLSPEFEQGDAFQARLSFYLTELAIAKAKSPSDSGRPQNSVIINNFGGSAMSDKLGLAIERHNVFIRRAARMISAHSQGAPLPDDALFTENELRDFDRFLTDCWSERSGMTPIEGGYVPPVASAYRSEYYKSSDPIAWLRAFKRSVEQSKGHFEALAAVASTGVHVGDTFNVVNSGQIATIGRNSNAEGNAFSQSWSKLETEINLEELASELAALRAEMRKTASTIEEDQAVADVGSAEKAAKERDGTSALRYLKAAGGWALGAATRIGTTVAAKAIENAMKL